MDWFNHGELSDPTENCSIGHSARYERVVSAIDIWTVTFERSKAAGKCDGESWMIITTFRMIWFLFEKSGRAVSWLAGIACQLVLSILATCRIGWYTLCHPCSVHGSNLGYILSRTSITVIRPVLQALFSTRSVRKKRGTYLDITYFRFQTSDELRTPYCS